ncbi:MAG: hypothetical protein JKY60_15840 [Kordiimonadaceae bacterium]|nr:hypothetical protein [Kordiimonadaceae bacterium]MBL4790441.1 hypothetical protein [Kordiimonadaceae bacterium]
MKKTLIGAFVAVSILSTSSFAAECGEVPSNVPNVPLGENVTSASIRTARTAVIAFSAEVDAYINCMSDKGRIIGPYMTEKQRERREEDLDNLHERRRTIQNKLNEAIRAFRRATRDE